MKTNGEIEQTKEIEQIEVTDQGNKKTRTAESYVPEICGGTDVHNDFLRWTPNRRIPNNRLNAVRINSLNKNVKALTRVEGPLAVENSAKSSLQTLINLGKSQTSTQLWNNLDSSLNNLDSSIESPSHTRFF